jgi:anti-sigma B factor antagonist
MTDLHTFDVEADRAGAQLTLYVDGELDAATAPHLLDAFDQHMADPADKVWIDLSAVSFIDSSGLAVLAKMHRRATAAGSNFKIADLSPKVDRIMQITGLDEVIPTYRTKTAANA